MPPSDADDTLTERQWRTIHQARLAMCQTLAASYPGDADRLLCVLVSSAFVEMLAASSTAGGRAVIEVVNDQLREAGLYLGPLQRN